MEIDDGVFECTFVATLFFFLTTKLRRGLISLASNKPNIIYEKKMNSQCGMWRKLAVKSKKIKIHIKDNR